MQDPERIKRILKLIEELWNKFPDQRLYQLLVNYTELGDRPTELKQMEVDGNLVSVSNPVVGVIKDPWNYEDDELENNLNLILKRLSRMKLEGENETE